jgi:hypothetical protein
VFDDALSEILEDPGITEIKVTGIKVTVYFLSRVPPGRAMFSKLSPYLVTWPCHV